MKLSFLPLLAVSAGLAVQVSAVTIRLDVVRTAPDGTPVVRFGHAGVPPSDAIANNAISMAEPADNNNPHPCPGKLMRDKAIRISNAFRKALGLPLIETSHENAKAEDLVHITPFPFIGTPPNVDTHHRVTTIRPHRVHKYHHNAPFLRRVHHALMTLGPWEGRAVAFVLGCGIGVLLRMFWVITIVTYRMIKGEREEAPEYALVFEHYDEVIRAPPSYTDEKVGEIQTQSVELVVDAKVHSTGA